MKNPLIQKFESYLSTLRESGSDSGWMREAISEIERLEGKLLESRMKIEAYEVVLNKRSDPVGGKKKANEKRLNDLFKAMKI